MMQFALACLLFCMGSLCGAGNTVTTYENLNGAWLGLHTEPAVFWDACDNCQREGGVLAWPTTDALVQAMLALMAKHNLKSSSVFTGMASEPKIERFLCTFSNGSLKEAASVPSDASDELCLALTGAGALNDVSCASAHPYICRKDALHAAHVGDVEVLNPCREKYGYEWHPLTGSCYKFHRIALPWRRALAACDAEGGMLAVINSPTESSVLKEMFKRNPASTISESDDPEHALVGFRKFEDGTWATVFGETLAEAGFEHWSTGEPNNLKEKENCGSLFQDGLFNDISCTRALPYICEITQRPKV